MSTPSTPFTEREAALMALGVALPRLQRGYRAAADRAGAHVGLSQAMAWPLVMIGRAGDGVRQGVLADMLAIESPSLVRPLEQLMESGFVERREDPLDRRAKTLHLTPAGTEARAQIEEALYAMRTELFQGVSDEDVASCLRVFAVLEARLGRGATLQASQETAG
ncbi:MarR family transcriptional regulator [Xylophilus sp. GW821-FHT01B05]